MHCVFETFLPLLDSSGARRLPLPLTPGLAVYVISCAICVTDDSKGAQRNYERDRKRGVDGNIKRASEQYQSRAR
ncbi:hypothetical protein K439DRAFT_1190520 [Ramaria rubella]|nr:hypothetical protein K439DRAFT_1190520 [Ramaria rubella]